MNNSKTSIVILLILVNFNLLIAKPYKLDSVTKDNPFNIKHKQNSKQFNGVLKNNMDTITSKMLSEMQYVKMSTDTRIDANYLYAFPPFPLPANNSVNFILYWDTSIEINNAEIAVFDVNGNKICGKEKITIDKYNTYNGLISWDSSRNQSGIYIIQIKHGTETVIVKVLLN